MSGTRKVEAIQYYQTYHGHETAYLESVLEALKEDSERIVYLAGDSSLDNKHWLFNSNNPKYSSRSMLSEEIAADAIQGYEKVLDPPRMIKDVAYFMNLEAKDQGSSLATINTSIEEATLGAHANGNLLDQDKFIRDNITENDILVVSIGGNDIALAATPCTGIHIACAVWCFPQFCIDYCGCSLVPDCGECIPGCCCDFCACPCVGGYFADMFKNKVERYIHSLTSKKVPKTIVVCMIYYLDESQAGSWADKVLSYLKYDTNPGKLQSLIRWTYRNATKNIRIKGAKVIAHPLFEDLDPKDTRDYDNRVEPSIQGGEKMGRSIFNTILQNESNSKKIY